MTDSTPAPTPPSHELWDWLDEPARTALTGGVQPTDEQFDAAADRRRAAELDNVRHLPTVTDGVLDVQPGQGWWTGKQRAALNSIGHEHTPDGDLIAFLHLAQSSGLDPFKNELYLIGRKDTTAPSGKKYTAQTGIGGFRTLAERTHLFGGIVETLWCGRDGAWTDVWLSEEPPTAARVVVRRTDRPDLAVATVLYREFCPMKDVWENNRRTGAQEPPAMWKKMPSHMLAKCAEALAIRQAFPRQAGNIYAAEEMGQADIEAANEERAEANLAAQNARRALVARPWADPAEPLSPGLASDSDIVDGEVVEELDRAGLLAELDEQATLFATTVAAMSRRTVARLHKNLEDFTDEELASLVRERREEAVAALLSRVIDATVIPETPEATEGPAAKPPTTQAGEEPTVGTSTRTTAKRPQNAAQAVHRYTGDGDGCTLQGCGAPVDADVHDMTR